MTTKVIDLGGWTMGRCTVEDVGNGEVGIAASLILCDPKNGDVDAHSFEIAGLDSLLKIKELIDDTIAAYEVERSLPKELG